MKKSMWLYNFLTWFLSGIFKVMFRVKTVGRENEVKEGPTIYCVNHISNWDPVLVACETKRPINFMSKKELFRIPVLKSILKALGAFPIDRTGNDIATLKTTVAALKDGACICLFPQGTRHPEKEPSETVARGGAAMLAKHAKATLVPISIYTKNYRIKLFRKVYITIGKPYEYDENDYQGSREDYDRVIKIVFDDICRMCDEAKEKANAKRK